MVHNIHLAVYPKQFTLEKLRPAKMKSKVGSNTSALFSGLGQVAVWSGILYKWRLNCG